MTPGTWKEKCPPLVIGAGLAVGAIAALLVKLGNPGNMGVCMACFERDIAGALGLHRAGPVQYLRPEIPGIVLGAFLAAVIAREATPRSGSSPAVRFLVGAFVMIGALVFLGCPTRMVLRLGGGDGNALVGLVGFTAGIAAGSLLLRRGMTLGRARKEGSGVSAWIMPVLALGGVALLLVRPAFLSFSEAPPGSVHAAMPVSLGAGIAVGVLGQRSRLCFAGGIRDMMLFRLPHLLVGVGGVFLGVLLLNLVLGKFSPGFAGQPAAHSAHVWNLLGMALVGLGSMLLGGCPFRQLVLASQGNGDSVVAVLGMLVGAAFAHNCGLAASPAGVPVAGMVAVGAGLAVCVAIGLVAKDA
jgi:YedE family putative selenium metabolism protein